MLLVSQAIKIVNTVKLKEDFDYESLCRKLENQVDLLTAEVERRQKLRENDRNELEKELRECQDSFGEVKKNLITRSEVVVFSMSFLIQLVNYWFMWIGLGVLHYSVIEWAGHSSTLPLISSACLQFLEKENTRLELEVKDILNELNRQQDQNELMRDKVAELEVSLKHSKVLSLL